MADCIPDPGYAKKIAGQARNAAQQLPSLTGSQKNAWLEQVAALLLERQDSILQANQLDLIAGENSGLSPAMLDRLRLCQQRMESLAAGVRQISALPDPVGEVISGGRRPNGLQVNRVRVPLGVVFFIFESRPNVTIDAAALCIKSGNSVILRGGREALHSNLALGEILQEALRTEGLPEFAVQLVEFPDRALVGEFLSCGDLIDVTIPRGGKSLIERVCREATMPVIRHYDGICHVFIDESADVQMAKEIIVNSKCQRPGVCNAAESLLIHRAALDRVWPEVAVALQHHKVELRCCRDSLALAPGAVAATAADYSTEHLALILNVKVVDSLEQAVQHIREFGSAHTDAIVTQSFAAAEAFETLVDSSAVVVNASTRFNDGGELGLGAEIGISTDRFHARGPCGLQELTTYKYVLRGTGQTRG